MSTPAVLALEDGTVFRGVSVGAKGNTTGEVVFNTAMTGYQEILTDPSYCRQIVTLTYPHIGNTGATPEDLESGAVYAAGLVVRDLPALYSNWRATESLQSFLLRCKVVAIADIDTRKLTRLLREKGAQSGCIMTGDSIEETAAVRAAKKFPGLKGMDLAKAVSTKKIYQWNDGLIWKTASQAAAPAKPSACGGLRLWHQAQHSADSRGTWLSDDCGSGTNTCRSGTCDESRWYFLK